VSLAGYLGKNWRASVADRKDRDGVKETERRYEGVAQYDPVLRSHCALDVVRATPREDPTPDSAK
jgi:hypothetical protein